MYRCMCNWVKMQYSTKLTEHCKASILEKNKSYYRKTKIKEKVTPRKKKKKWETFGYQMRQVARRQLGALGEKCCKIRLGLCCTNYKYNNTL